MNIHSGGKTLPAIFQLDQNETKTCSETPLSLISGIRSRPGRMVMTLVNGGAILDFRTKVIIIIVIIIVIITVIIMIIIINCHQYYHCHHHCHYQDGSTAMHRAVATNNVEAVRTMLELGASPNYRDR